MQETALANTSSVPVPTTTPARRARRAGCGVRRSAAAERAGHVAVLAMALELAVPAYAKVADSIGVSVHIGERVDADVAVSGVADTRRNGGAFRRVTPGVRGEPLQAGVKPVVFASAPNPEQAEAALTLTHEQRVPVQLGLHALAFDVGPADGLFGPRTRRAIGRWQAWRGEVPTGYLDAGEAEMLFEAGVAVRAPQTQGVVGQGAAEILAEALRTARSVADDEERALVLGEIAVVQTKAGDRHGATRSVAEALNTARSITGDFADDSRGRALEEIVGAQAKMGDLPGALGTARSISESTERIVAFHTVAKALATAGDRRGAARVIAEALRGAKSTANSQRQTASAVGESAKVKAETKSRDSTPANDEGNASAHSLHATVNRLADSIAENASVVISEVDAARSRLALGLLAEMQTELGDFAGARNTARRIGSETAWADVASDIAKSQAKAGDIAGALRTARGIANDSSRASALRHVAVAQAMAGDVAGAMRTSSHIGEHQSRVIALCAIAEAQARAGDRRGAATSFLEAMILTSTVEVDLHRGDMFVFIAEAQERTGHDTGRAIDKALGVARSHSILFFRDLMLNDIVEVQANSGDIAGALDTTRIMLEDTPDWHPAGDATAFRTIAEAQAKAGKITGALHTARSISDDAKRASALARIADALLDGANGR